VLALKPKPGDPAPAATFVIFGGAGDLSKRLLMPAIVNLTRDKLIGEDLDILVVSHGEGSDEQIREQLTEHLELDDADTAAAWAIRKPRIRYFRGGFEDMPSFERLAGEIGHVPNLAFYLATAPKFFGTIAENLAKAGLMDESKGFRRLVIEKPFGRDLATAKALNKQLLAVMDESQIFRIDHFLGKETVQNIMMTRFGNAFFEAMWNARYVDHVEITAAEVVDVGTRGAFYDHTGALRDMIPNHLFQLLAMIGMEPPNSFNSEAVRNEKAKVLDAVRVPTEAEAREAVRGRYVAGKSGGKDVIDYVKSPKIEPDSRTETYAAIKLMVDTWRWAGVPFYLRTGKALTARDTKITIRFKPIALALFRSAPDVGEIPSNTLTIQVQPNEGISLDFVAKRPGPIVETSPVHMDFRYVDAFKLGHRTGYETLIYDMLIGDPSLFQRADMVERGWTIVQPILDHWESEGAPEDYVAGTAGPPAADALLERDGRHWYKIG
jgi:glucose-6-phosphate 1-dehydrogenase